MTTEDTFLTLTRLLDAPIDRVFDAWLSREEWQAWIGPEDVACEVPLLEPRVGGRYRISMRLSDGRYIPVTGVFTVIEAPSRLAFTWSWEGDPGTESLVTISLREAGDQTELTLRHEGLGNLANRDGHEKGWSSALNKLVAYLGSGRRSASIGESEHSSR